MLPHFPELHKRTSQLIAISGVGMGSGTYFISLCETLINAQDLDNQVLFF